MKKTILLILLWVATCTLTAMAQTDPRCVSFLGIPLEGRADTIVSLLKQKGFAAWGESDDGEALHFRGNYYGIRSKLMIDTDPKTGFVSSAYVTIGPYSTKEFFARNYTYILLQLKRDHGDFIDRQGAYYHLDDYGTIKLSEQINENGSHDIKVFYLPTTPFYKDATHLGLKGNVMEVVTENPVFENVVEHFGRDGRMEQPEIVDREYSEYGYLMRATMQEKSGQNSKVEYEYDAHMRLVRRTLVNPATGIRSVIQYTFDEEDDGDEPMSQNQRVFDKNGTCVLSITVTNDYEARDDTGNWTRNKIKLTYWEKESGTQQAELVQTRSISYWE